VQVSPPFACPEGTEGSDLNGNGRVDRGECTVPVVNEGQQNQRQIRSQNQQQIQTQNQQLGVQSAGGGVSAQENGNLSRVSADVSKTANCATIDPQTGMATVTGTITIQSKGEETLVITDATDIVTWRPGGTTLTTVDNVSGLEGQTVGPQGSANDTLTVNYTIPFNPANNTAFQNRINIQIANNQTRVPRTNPDGSIKTFTNTDDFTFCTQTTPQADISLVKSGNGPIEAGADAVFTIVVTNNGPDVAENVVVTDTVPAGFTTTNTACVLDSGTLTCTYATLAVGAANAQTITLTKTTTRDDCGTISNTATVSSDTQDTNTGNNSSTATITVTCAPVEADVTITKSAESATVLQGANAVFTILVESLDDTDAATGVVVTDVLPAGLTFVSATGTGVTCTEAAGTVTCTLSGPLAAQDSVTITLTATVASDATCGATITNTATVSAATGSNTNDQNDSASADITVTCEVTGSFTVNKQYVIDGTAVDDTTSDTRDDAFEACFELRQGGTAVDTSTTDEGDNPRCLTGEGSIVFDDLPLGTFYTVVESTIPAGCTADEGEQGRALTAERPNAAGTFTNRCTVPVGGTFSVPVVKVTCEAGYEGGQVTDTTDLPDECELASGVAFTVTVTAGDATLDADTTPDDGEASAGFTTNASGTFDITGTLNSSTATLSILETVPTGTTLLGANPRIVTVPGNENGSNDEVIFTNVEDQADTGNIAVFKMLCDSIGQQDTCNGRDTSLDGYTIDFQVFAGADTNTGTPIETITVTLSENAEGQGNTGNGSQGRSVSGDLLIGTYTVCEVEVATSPDGQTTVPLDAEPRPDESTGGANQQEFGGNCITVTITAGTAELKFLDLRADEEVPTGEIIVTKQYTLDGNEIGDDNTFADSFEVCFTLTQNGQPVAGQAGRCVTGEGSVTFTGLPLGDYTVTETLSAGNPCLLADGTTRPVTLSVESSQSANGTDDVSESATFTNACLTPEEPTGDITVEKLYTLGTNTDFDGGDLDACFTLYNDVDNSGTFTTGDTVARSERCVVDGEGSTTFSNLPLGAYVVVETTVPDDCTNNGPLAATLTENDPDATLTFTNTCPPPTGGAIEVTVVKVTCAPGYTGGEVQDAANLPSGCQLASGVSFTASVTGGTLPNGASYITNNSGTFLVDVNLTAATGQLTLVEMVPSGTTALDPSKTVDLTQGTNAGPVIFTNVRSQRVTETPTPTLPVDEETETPETETPTATPTTPVAGETETPVTETPTATPITPVAGETEVPATEAPTSTPVTPVAAGETETPVTVTGVPDTGTGNGLGEMGTRQIATLLLLLLGSAVALAGMTRQTRRKS
jgi:uncharacterized repeat protein (TIGR01451 family)